MRITMMQEMEQRVNVQLVEQHPHYYQGATISEIEDSTATAVEVPAAAAHTVSCHQQQQQTAVEHSAFTARTTSSPGISGVTSSSSHAVQVQHHPQAVQASPVLVLHDDQRHRLRQKALVDSVESKV